MKNLLERDKIKRALFSRNESSRVALKYISSNKELPLKVRWLAAVELSKLPLKSSPVKIRNRCSETFRSNSAFRDFRFLESSSAIMLDLVKSRVSLKKVGNKKKDYYIITCLSSIK